MPAGFRRETRLAIDAVTHAFAIARRGVAAGEVTAKDGRDVVTSADIAVEDAVRGILTDALSCPVIGEERGDAGRGGPATAYWLLDPLCGTRNFVSRIPLYCVNLALVEHGDVTVAVVGDPSTGEITVAERGRGAWSLEAGAPRRLATSDASRTIVVEDGKAKGSRREQAARFVGAAIRADRWDFRSLGTTLASPYLAAGRIAAYAVFCVSAIHAAAGSLLVLEAGGTVSDIAGCAWTVQSDSFVGSANARLHGELLELGRAGA
jgi:myo-inositol-1(or 4)-monophosphatase